MHSLFIHRFAAGDEVTLVFTVTGSGAFQGCAKMKSAAGRDGVSCITRRLGVSFRGEMCTSVLVCGLVKHAALLRRDEECGRLGQGEL